MSDAVDIRTDELSWRQVDDEVVILDLRTSKYLSLNGTAALLWTTMAAGCTTDDLVDAVVSTYDVDREVAARDVSAFVADCAARGLVQ